MHLNELFGQPAPVRHTGLTADAVQSVLTGLGVQGADKTRSVRPADPVWLSLLEAESLPLIDAVIRAAIYAVPEDAIGQGWRVDSGTQRDVTAGVDADLLLVERLIELDSTARQYGGAIALVVTDAEDLSKPLPPGPHKVHAVHVFTGREVVPLSWELDLRSQDWSTPSQWSLTPLRQGVGTYGGQLRNVHRSHLVYMPGLPRPRSQVMPILGLDLSVPQAYWERARDLGIALGSAAIQAMEHGMKVLNIQDGRTMLAGAATDLQGPQSAFAAAMELFDRTSSTLKTAVTTGNNTLSRLEGTLAGYADVVRLQYEQLGAIERVPLTVMLGLTPTGLGSDDIAARRQYEGFITRHRRARCDGALKRIYDIALGPDLGRTVVWPALYPPTPTERADLSLKLAQRDQILIGIGEITADEGRARIDAEAGEDEAILPVLQADPVEDLGMDQPPAEEGEPAE